MADASDDLKLIRWLVTLRVKNLGYKCEEAGPDALTVTGPDGQRQDLPLASLHQAATALSRDEWGVAIGEFLDSMLNPASPADEDLDTIRPLLRTKLVPEEAARKLDAGPRATFAVRFQVAGKGTSIIDLGCPARHRATVKHSSGRGATSITFRSRSWSISDFHRAVSISPRPKT